MGSLFYDNIDSNGLIYWYETVKIKIEEDAKFKKLILKGLGYKDAG